MQFRRAGQRPSQPRQKHIRQVGEFDDSDDYRHLELRWSWRDPDTALWPCAYASGSGGLWGSFSLNNATTSKTNSGVNSRLSVDAPAFTPFLHNTSDISTATDKTLLRTRTRTLDSDLSMMSISPSLSSANSAESDLSSKCRISISNSIDTDDGTQIGIRNNVLNVKWRRINPPPLLDIQKWTHLSASSKKPKSYNRTIPTTIPAKNDSYTTSTYSLQQRHHGHNYGQRQQQARWISNSSGYL